MARVLIPSHPGDVHAIAVEQLLERKGHEAVIWHTADFPTRLSASLLLGRDAPTRWKVKGNEIELRSDEPFDVVWYRRPSPPVVSPDLDPGDRVVAEREAAHFHRGLWNLIAPDAFWVNPFSPRAPPPTKPVQLDAARTAGLAIPQTLCSNDPAEIQAFIERVGGAGIYKPFNPVQWRIEGGVAHLFTAPVEMGDLRDENVLRLCPGIFQERLEKAYELRVTWMGATPIVARLDTRKVQAAALDWRNAGWSVPVASTSLPADVAGGCRRLMQRLGLVFGCFDFVVTPAGEYVFLEVNEMGQFLWLEEVAQQLPLLDAFCEFLVSRDAEFHYTTQAGWTSYLELRTTVEARAELERAVHVAAAEWTVSDLGEPSSRWSGLGAGSGLQTNMARPRESASSNSDHLDSCGPIA